MRRLERWLWLGLAAFVTLWFIAMFAIPAYRPEAGPDARSTGTLIQVMIGLLLGSIITLHVYDQVNRENQRRGWRHDYALSRIERIYGPLYDETVAHIEAVDEYRDVMLSPRGPFSPEVKVTGFYEVTNSHLKIFVDKEALDLLMHFHAALQGYKGVHQEVRREAHNAADRATRELTRTTGPSDAPNIRGVLHNNLDKLLNPQRPDWEEAAFQKYRDAFLGYRMGDEANARAGFQAALEAIRGVPSTEFLGMHRRSCLERGQAARERLEVIIQDPTRVVLEFEERG
jgi:hypothetical protein